MYQNEGDLSSSFLPLPRNFLRGNAAVGALMLKSSFTNYSLKSYVFWEKELRKSGVAEGLSCLEDTQWRHIPLPLDADLRTVYLCPFPEHFSIMYDNQDGELEIFEIVPFECLQKKVAIQVLLMSSLHGWGAWAAAWLTCPPNSSSRGHRGYTTGGQMGWWVYTKIALKELKSSRASRGGHQQHSVPSILQSMILWLCLSFKHKLKQLLLDLRRASQTHYQPELSDLDSNWVPVPSFWLCPLINDSNPKSRKKAGMWAKVYFPISDF